MQEATEKKRVHIKTFGCQMNVYDSERMLSLLGEKGYQSEGNLREADVILINTCSVRDKSEHKVLSLLGELKPLKEKNSGLVIGISGCVAQRMGRTLLQKAPHLDLVFGPDSVDRVVELVEGVRSQGKRTVEAKFDNSGRSYTQPAVVVAKAKPSEFLTIMKGCDHFCTYCIVPFVRGREKSRPIAEILEDVRRYVAKGSKEIVFLGQNINTYGKGTSENLPMLIDASAQVEGLDRIRYITSHPRDLNQAMIDQFGSVEKLMPQLHLPFQAGSDKVLKRMSRLYTRADYMKKIELLKKARPDISMSTDVIVGFPGETEEDFQQTIEVMKEVRFGTAFLFKYSPRPGTRAHAFDPADEVPEHVKEDRLKRLQEVAFPIIEEDNLKMIGETTPVLVEALDKKNRHYSGRNPHGKLVHVLNAGPAAVGKIIDVEITEAKGSNLRGHYVGAPRVIRTSDCRAEEALSASL